MKKIFAVSLLAAGMSLSAQNVYSFGFDTAFTAEWTLTNQSSEPTDVLWSKAAYTTPPSPGIFGSSGTLPNGQAGGANSFGLVNFTSTDADTISNWLITPSVNVKDGDVVSIYTRKGTDGNIDYPDRLELRYSTAPTAVIPANGPDDVGSFTNLGVSVNPNLLGNFVYPKTWTKYQFTVSGVGTTPVATRFAFRYFVLDGGPSGANSDIIGIDTFSVDRTALGTAETNVKAGLRIYPNPASDFITVDTDKKVGAIVIFDMSGKLVKKSTEGKTLDVKALTPGVYNVQVQTEDGVNAYRIVKK